MGRTGERAWRTGDTGAPKKKVDQKSGYKTAKKKDCASRNTDAPKKKPKQTQKSGYNMGMTREPAWRNTDTHSKRREAAWGNTDRQKKKLKHDNDGVDVIVVDDHDDDDVELLDTKQDQFESDETASPLSDISGYNMSKTREPDRRNTDTQKKKPKQTQKVRGKRLSNDLDDDEEDVADHDDDVELLDIVQDQCELDENVSPMLDFLEKFASPQSDIICVQGYKVKQSNATILESIFQKHGDIAAECVFKTNSVRSSVLDVVCEVVRQIQTNDVIKKMKELECRVSDAEAANVDVTWLRAHLKGVKESKVTSEKFSVHTEMKENVILVQKVAQMDLRERCSELMVAQQRFKEAERCVRVLHLVEKNLNDHILQSKAKIDSWLDHPVV